jgi:hypothetical protein
MQALNRSRRPIALSVLDHVGYAAAFLASAVAALVAATVFAPAAPETADSERVSAG